MHCPRCRVPLNRATIPQGVLFCCPQCGGRAIGLPPLREIGSRESIRRLWKQACDTGTPSGVACPVCDRAMAEVVQPISSNLPPLRIDVCTRCEFVWFDPREFEQYSQCQPAGPEPLSDKAREAIAVVEARRVAQKAERDAYNDPGPSESWHWIPAMLGLPVEENAPALQRIPWVTYGLSALLVAVFAMTFNHLRAAIDGFGLVPAELGRHGGLTFITSFFLHAGVFHLIGNVYFLLIFGDNVEDDMGRRRYVLLLLAASLFGDLLHIVWNPHDMTPCVGASGGISGVIAYYALRYPQARLGMMFGRYFYYGWVHFPAYAGLLFWFLMQILLAFQQKMGVGNVAAFAHLGGAFIGFIAWLLWRVNSLQESESV
jgi:membrane associated rhomboid family serine protease/Zn-finger nucleic acid-binding protein